MCIFNQTDLKIKIFKIRSEVKMVKKLSENNLIKIEIIPVYVSINSSKSLSISEFRKRRKLKKTVNILENIYSFLCDRTIMDFRESRKLVLPAYKSEVQYEVLKHWVNQLVYCFTELNGILFHGVEWYTVSRS